MTCLHTLTNRFATNKIVHSYCLVLKEYRNNSESVNHAIVKMLYRIAVHLNMAPLLYQISVFRTLQSVLDEPTSNRVKVQPYCITLQGSTIYSVVHVYTRTTTLMGVANCFEVVSGPHPLLSY